MKTVIEMWHKAWPDAGTFVRASAQDLERFAELVRADEREQGQRWFDAVTAQHKQAILAEREACAKVAAGYGESRPIASKNLSSLIVGRWEGEQAASLGIESAIRARSNT